LAYSRNQTARRQTKTYAARRGACPTGKKTAPIGVQLVQIAHRQLPPEAAGKRRLIGVRRVSLLLGQAGLGVGGDSGLGIGSDRGDKFGGLDDATRGAES